MGNACLCGRDAEVQAIKPSKTQQNKRDLRKSTPTKKVEQAILGVFYSVYLRPPTRNTTKENTPFIPV